MAVPPTAGPSQPGPWSAPAGGHRPPPQGQQTGAWQRPPGAPPQGPSQEPPRGQHWGPGSVPPRRRGPAERTSSTSLGLLLASAALLLAGLVLPMLIPQNAHWMSGPTLIQYGPHLLGGESSWILTFFMVLAGITAVVGVALLLGSARLVTRRLAVLLGLMAAIGLLLSLFLALVVAVGASVNEGATAGVAAYSLPLGFIGTMAAAFVPSLRDGWIKPDARP